jgi:hypothetical protein
MIMQNLYKVQSEFKRNRKTNSLVPSGQAVTHGFRNGSSIERIIAYKHQYGLSNPLTKLKSLGSHKYGSGNTYKFRTHLGGQVMGVSVRSSVTGEPYPSVFVPLAGGAGKPVSHDPPTFGGS